MADLTDKQRLFVAEYAKDKTTRTTVATTFEVGGCGEPAAPRYWARRLPRKGARRCSGTYKSTDAPTTSTSSSGLTPGSPRWSEHQYVDTVSVSNASVGIYQGIPISQFFLSMPGRCTEESKPWPGFLFHTQASRPEMLSVACTAVIAVPSSFPPNRCRGRSQTTIAAW